MTNTLVVGKPETRRVNRWFVPNSAVGMGYWVERMGDVRWRCCCPSRRWRRQQLCKHVIAVIRQKRQGVTMG